MRVSLNLETGIGLLASETSETTYTEFTTRTDEGNNPSVSGACLEVYVQLEHQLRRRCFLC